MNLKTFEVPCASVELNSSDEISLISKNTIQGKFTPSSSLCPGIPKVLEQTMAKSEVTKDNNKKQTK